MLITRVNQIFKKGAFMPSLAMKSLLALTLLFSVSTFATAIDVKGHDWAYEASYCSDGTKFNFWKGTGLNVSRWAHHFEQDRFTTHFEYRSNLCSLDIGGDYDGVYTGDKNGLKELVQTNRSMRESNMKACGMGFQITFGAPFTSYYRIENNKLHFFHLGEGGIGACRGADWKDVFSLVK
jgi:hypothetical protein